MANDDNTLSRVEKEHVKLLVRDVLKEERKEFQIKLAKRIYYAAGLILMGIAMGRV